MNHKQAEIEHDNDDTSDYLLDGETTEMDFGGLFSQQFSNITSIYTSPSGPCEIYSATRYGKRFILKGLKEKYRNDPINNLALAKEFEIGIFLDHPNIRRTLGLEDVEGLGKVIVLEYVDGCSLATLIDSGRLSAPVARDILSQVRDALTYIHSKQVYHRDLKPSNILVSHKGNIVKIIDFNLSDNDTFVVLKNPAGSKRYMAPELSAPGAKPTVAADIYSFGVIIDEMAAATGDILLAEAAEKCIKKAPDKRPGKVSLIKLPSPQHTLAQSLSRFLSSATLTWILVTACIVLSIVIVTALLKS